MFYPYNRGLVQALAIPEEKNFQNIFIKQILSQSMVMMIEGNNYGDDDDQPTR